MTLLLNHSSISVIRLLIKLFILFFAFYFDLPINVLGVILLVILISEGYEFAGQFVIRKYPAQTKSVYMVIGGLNSFLMVWILAQTNLLSNDYYLFIFPLLIIMSARSGLLLTIGNSIISASTYLVFISGDVEYSILVIRSLAIIATGITSGLISEFAQQAYQRYLAVSEMNDYRNEAKNLKNEFLLIAHHSLRTPLSQLKGYHEALLDTDLSETERNTLTRNMGESLHRTESIIEHILATITLESHKGKLTFQDLDIVGLLLSQINIYRRSAQKKNIQLKFDIPEKPISMLADAKGLNMAIGKLLDNAIKYTPDSGMITAILQELDTVVIIDIKDNGPGILKEDLEHIFEQGFHRVNAMTPTVEGMGIGLYMSKLIIEEHGGTIEAQSVVNKGTTFTITLPKLSSRKFFEDIV